MTLWVGERKPHQLVTGGATISNNLDSKKTLASPCQKSTEKLSSPVTQREVMKMILREWRPYLKLAEFSVLMVIADRTLMWGKLWERITLHHFTHGISRSGEVYCGGTGLSSNTVLTAIRGLHDNGFILAEKNGQACRYALNYNWEECNIMDDRKLNTVQNVVAMPKKERRKPETRSVQEILTDLREKQKKRAAEGNAKLTQVKLACILQKYLNGATVTQSDITILYAYAKRYQQRKGHALTYLEWVFARWAELIPRKFHWMTDKPLGIAPRFLVKFAKTFEDAFEHNEIEDRKSAMSPIERRVLDLKEQGMNDAAAKLLAKKEHADQRKLDMLTKAANKLADERHKLQEAKLKMGGQPTQAVHVAKVSGKQAKQGYDMTTVTNPFTDDNQRPTIGVRKRRK